MLVAIRANRAAYFALRRDQAPVCPANGKDLNQIRRLFLKLPLKVIQFAQILNGGPL